MTYAVNPTVRIEAGADHPLTVTRSENQYMTKAKPSHVLFSGGTGSWSAFVQMSGGAMLLDCLGSFQLEGSVRRWCTLEPALLNRD